MTTFTPHYSCNYDYLIYIQVNREVTNSVIASVEVTSMALCRSLDVGEPPIRLSTPTLTVSSSRHDPADLGNLRDDFGFGSNSGISLPADFHVDTSASILLAVSHCFQNIQMDHLKFMQRKFSTEATSVYCSLGFYLLVSTCIVTSCESHLLLTRK